MHGPYCPIYGFGAIIMLLSLIKLKENVVLLFIVSFVVLSVWEYLASIILEKIYHTKYWDYSDKKFNFKGRICLANSFYWGILGLIFIEIMHPFISKYVEILPINIILYFVL